MTADEGVGAMAADEGVGAMAAGLTVERGPITAGKVHLECAGR